MKKIVKYIKKKKVLSILIILSLIIFFVWLGIYIKDTQKRQCSLASKLYNQAHDIYFYGGNIEYEYDKDGDIIYTDRSDGNLINRYLKTKNYNEVITNLFSESMQKKVGNYLGVLIQDGTIYVKEIGKGISNYYGTTFKVKASSSSKIVFDAYSKFCKMNSKLGEYCKNEDGYYTVKKKFVLVKENKKWKIDNYTSVFEFENDEIK